MRVRLTHLEGLRLDLEPGWYELPSHLPADERLRLLDLISEALPGVENSVECDWTELQRLGPGWAPSTLALVRLASTATVDQDTATLRQLTPRHGLYWVDVPGRWPERAWPELDVKIALTSWLRRSWRRPTHPLASLGIAELPVEAVSAVTCEPIELLVLIELTLAFAAARFEPGQVNWDACLSWAIGRRLAARLARADPRLRAELVATLCAADDGLLDALTPAPILAELARLGLAQVSEGDGLLAPLARRAALPEIFALLEAEGVTRPAPTLVSSGPRPRARSPREAELGFAPTTELSPDDPRHVDLRPLLPEFARFTQRFLASMATPERRHRLVVLRQFGSGGDTLIRLVLRDLAARGIALVPVRGFSTLAPNEASFVAIMLVVLRSVLEWSAQAEQPRLPTRALRSLRSWLVSSGQEKLRDYVEVAAGVDEELLSSSVLGLTDRLSLRPAQVSSAELLEQLVRIIDAAQQHLVPRGARLCLVFDPLDSLDSHSLLTTSIMRHAAEFDRLDCAIVFRFGLAVEYDSDERPVSARWPVLRVPVLEPGRLAQPRAEAIAAVRALLDARAELDAVFDEVDARISELLAASGGQIRTILELARAACAAASGALVGAAQIEQARSEYALQQIAQVRGRDWRLLAKVAWTGTLVAESSTGYLLRKGLIVAVGDEPRWIVHPLLDEAIAAHEGPTPESVDAQRRRLEFLQRAEVVEADPAVKFTIRKKIATLEARLASWMPDDARSRGEARVAPTRLVGAPTLFGRERELGRFDEAWDDDLTRVMTIVAWGGVGKTALVHEWRQRLLSREDEVWVFDWSFYSQGTRDRGAVSSESFVREALRFFGDPVLAESKASDWDKGARLAELVGERRALLILDGLEPLQEPPGASGRVGGLREPAVATLLKGLANRNQGLCLVTTRVAVRELVPFEGTTAPRLELEHLSRPAGAALLGSMLGDVESTLAEREAISEAVRGHALSLQLFGSYIRRALGDVRRWREVDLERADEDHGGHAFRVMDAYVSWLQGAGDAGARELAVLRVMGLFDRPATPGCVAALLEAPAIPGLTEALMGVGLDRDGWQLLLASLEEARLISCSRHEAVQIEGFDEATARATPGKNPPKGEPEAWPLEDAGPDAQVLDAHPLVREYFGGALRRANEAGWREGHRRLYEHLRGSVPYWPEGNVGLQPLYQAVVHGCAAGRVQEACDTVYWGRIRRGPRAYNVKQLGALGANLAVLASFFEGSWDRPASELGAGDRSWLLDVAAFSLRGVGRLGEALAPVRAGLAMHVEAERWKNAAIGAGNLSELELTLGQLRAAEEDAAQAVAHADRSRDEFERLVARTALADARLATGKLAEARELFEAAESMEAERSPHAPELTSVGGHRYCDLLLCPAERTAWRGWPSAATADAELLATCAEVYGRATRALEHAVRAHWFLSIGLDHLTLGRAALYAVRLRGASATPTPELALARAREHLDTAVARLREAGDQEFIAKGLLTRAWLRALDGDAARARADLDEASAIATRGPMPLYLADVHLHRARLFQDREALKTARASIEQHGYARRLPELEDAERALADL